MDDIKFRSHSRRSVNRNAPTHVASALPVGSNKAIQHSKSSRIEYKYSVTDPLIPIDRLKQPRNKKRHREPVKVSINRWLVLALLITLICLVGYLLFSYLSSRNTALEGVMDPNNNSEELALAIKKEASKYLGDVPKEVPKLETVSNTSVTGSGARFKDVEKGDKILIFASAGKAIIYRPSTGKIIAYSQLDDPVDRSQETTTESAPEESTEAQTSPEVESSNTESTTDAEGSPLIP